VQATGSDNCRDSIVPETHNNRSSELLITQAFASLSAAPKGEHGERTISLAQIGNYEIRMVGIGPSGAVVPLFWLELFDQAVGSAVDSCQCNTIREAVALFEELVAQAGVS
jgi:hypothetical protein